MNKTNKSSIKTLMIICLLCFIFFSYTNKVLGVVKPTNNFYVNDYANLLDEETEKYIIESNIKLNELTGAQIVIVTVESLEGDSLEEYANKLFREFGIGDKDKNNGLLLLLALEERQFRVEVGYGLEGILPDAKTGRIQDEYIIPYLKKDDWNNGIKNGFSAILKEICNEYNLNIELQEPNKIQKNPNIIYIFEAIVLLPEGIFFGIVIRAMLKKQSGRLMPISIFMLYFTSSIFKVIVTDFISFITGIIVFVVGIIIGWNIQKFILNNKGRTIYRWRLWRTIFLRRRRLFRRRLWWRFIWRLFWRRLFWWRRFFRRRRKFKKLLKIAKVYN